MRTDLLKANECSTMNDTGCLVGGAARLSLFCSIIILAAGSLTADGAEPIEFPDGMSIAARFGFNIQASFRNVGSRSLPNPGPPVGGGIDRFYDDGYVRVDGSGNLNGQTWFWGYERASQVNAAADTI